MRIRETLLGLAVALLFLGAVFFVTAAAVEWREQPAVAVEPAVYSLECEEAIRSFFREVNDDVEGPYDTQDTQGRHEYWGHELFARHEAARDVWATRAGFDAWIAPFCP